MSNIWMLNQTADDILNEAIAKKDFSMMSTLVDVYRVPVKQCHVNLATRTNEPGSEMEEYLQIKMIV